MWCISHYMLQLTCLFFYSRLAATANFLSEMDNHSGDDSVWPSEMHDASILVNVCETSGEIQNGDAVTVNDVTCEMEDNGVTASIEDKFSGQDENLETDSAGNVLPLSESIPDEPVPLFDTDATFESDMKMDNCEENKIESEIPTESVSFDCFSPESTTLFDGVSSGEAALVTNQNTRSSKPTLIMLDDDEDEEERHERFLRIDTVEKPFGDGRNEAGEKIYASKRSIQKDANKGSTSSSTTR